MSKINAKTVRANITATISKNYVGAIVSTVCSAFGKTYVYFHPFNY